MIQVQTYAVYLLLFVVMYILAINTAATKSMKPIVTGLIIYAVVFGLRYGVGADFFNYHDNYADLQAGLHGFDCEFGFSLLTSSLAHAGLPSWVYFAVIAFLQIFFVFLAEKDNKNLLPLLVFTFMFSASWLSFSNGLRQVLAFCFFAYALKLIEDKKIAAHYLMLFLAFSMHKSAIVLLLVYPFFLLRTKDKKRKNPRKENPLRDIIVRVGLIAVAVVIGRTNFIVGYLDYLDKLMLLAGYGDYGQSEQLHNLVASETMASVGIGYFVNLSINLVIVIAGKWTKSFFKSKRVTVIYDLMFIGILVHYLFQSSQIINRMNMYLYGFGFIMSAYTLYQFKKRRKQWYFIILAGLNILLFVGFLSKMTGNDSAFYFLWQADLFNA